MFRFNHIEGMDTTCVRITGELVVTSEEHARGLAPCHRATFILSSTLRRTFRSWLSPFRDHIKDLATALYSFIVEER